MNECVGADDITGRNECPLFLRITAIHQTGDEAGRYFLSTEAVFGEKQTKDYIQRILNSRPRRGSYCWVEIGGKREELPSIQQLSTRLKVSAAWIRRCKNLAVAEGKTWTEYNGMKFGWVKGER